MKLYISIFKEKFIKPFELFSSRLAAVGFGVSLDSSKVRQQWGVGSISVGFGLDSGWVWDFGFGVPGFGFRVPGLGFRLSGFGFRVSSFGFR